MATIEIWFKLSFCRWTCDICSTCKIGSTCSTCGMRGTCTEWGSACWLRYLFHLKLFIKCAIRERERGGTKEREREKERERGRGRWRETRRETGRGRGTEREREEEEGEEEDKDKEKMNYTEARKENDEGKEKEKGQEKEKETKKKKDTVHIKKWLLLYKVAPASDLEKFAATVNPENNLLKWTGPSHGPVPWKFAEKLFFNKGLISGLILLGQGDTQDFFQKKWSCFFAQTCFLTKKNVCQDFLPQWWTFQILLGDWICCFFFHNSEPRH